MASDNLFARATRLSVLLVNQAPGWAPQSDSPLALPAVATAGVALGAAPSTWLHISLREEAHRRTARLKIPTLNVGDTFTVTIDGTAVAYDSTGDADLDEVVGEIADAISADPTAGDVVTAEAINAATGTTAPDSGRDTVVLRGKEEPDWTLDFQSSGSSLLEATADAAGADYRLFYLMATAPGFVAPAQWAASREGAVDQGGLLTRLESGGVSRAFLHVPAIATVVGDGSIVVARSPSITFGPALVG